VVIILVALAFILPKTAVAQSIVNILRTWTLGNASTAVQVEGDFTVTSNESDEIVIQSATDKNLDEINPEDFVDESQSPLEASLSFEDAANIVNFHIVQPAFIPEGYESQGVIVVNEEKIQMDYMKTTEIGLVGLTQTLVDGINGPIQLTFSDDIVPVDVQINGNDGLWITDPNVTDMNAFGILIWDDDGVNYQLQLMGSESNLETALKIAASIQ